MTPGARIAAAIEVLDRWQAGEPAEKALTTWARGARYAGSKDRAAIRDRVYDVLRRLESCAALGGGRDGRALMIGLCRMQGQEPQALFTGGYAPDPLTEVEVRVPEVDPDAWSDVPEWLQGRLKDALGDSAETVMEAMQDRAPLYLRVNARNDAMVEERLANDGTETEYMPPEGALKVVGGARRVRQSQPYLSGQVEVQDLSPQRAVAMIDWPQSGRILDYCAGGGGKALAIAARSDAAIHVHDVNPARMRDIAPRAERAKVTLHPFDNTLKYDVVLTDVPCSGSGTWRRDPEAKWHLAPERLDDLTQIQAQIMDEAAALLRPGGRLVYMTCSLLCEENEDQVAAFLARHRGWSRTTMARFAPPEASDGFFVAELTHPG